MFGTKNLTKESAEAAARAAARLSGAGHCFYQARNGRYRWGRMRFLVLAVSFTFARKVWYVSSDGMVIQVKE